jgi:tetratricopeptide (TPR) repeat protein
LVYLRRGFARLFVRNKDDKYADAIADFSNAINAVQNQRCRAAQYYRACAYFLNGDYERARFSWDALAAAGHSTPQPGFVPSTHEALGKTYMAMSRYSEAVHELEEALRNDYFANNILPDFNLIHLYREACQRMNNA